jgi:hypothetical protein
MRAQEDLNLHDLEDQNKEREEEIDLGDEEEQVEIETWAARASEEKQGLDKSDSQRRQVLVNNSVIFIFILFYFLARN